MVEHSGATVLLVDPGVRCRPGRCHGQAPHRAGRDRRRRSCSPRPHAGAEPRPWEPDEGATASINYTSGTTARPKGVQLTHRNCWLNAAVFGWHVAVTDRDIYMHTLPMFHCNGWGMPYAVTAMGVPQVVVRKIDGEEILRRIDQPWGHPAVRGPGGRRGRARRRGRPAGQRGGRSRGGTASASSWPGPRPRRRPSSGSRPSWAGSSSRSTG